MSWNQIKSAWYFAGGFCGIVFGSTYLYPMLYRTFCEKVGIATPGASRKELDYSTMHDTTKIHRKFDIYFKASAEPDLKWSFFPLQESVTVNAGETVLAFYRAHNANTKSTIGISAYVVQPDDAVQYFNKIQCFCFDEQMLNPQEEVDLPLFFYLDPKIAEDSSLADVKEVTLMYTFYLAQDQTLATMLAEHPNSPLKRPLVAAPTQAL
jgi:cytochrome c oxidase assembly protein subunit 11